MSYHLFPHKWFFAWPYSLSHGQCGHTCKKLVIIFKNVENKIKSNIKFLEV